jgi:hypothetical protein
VRRQGITAVSCAVAATFWLIAAIDAAAQPVDPVATRQVQALFDD